MLRDFFQLSASVVLVGLMLLVCLPLSFLFRGLRTCQPCTCSPACLRLFRRLLNSELPLCRSLPLLFRVLPSVCEPVGLVPVRLPSCKPVGFVPIRPPSCEPVGLVPVRPPSCEPVDLVPVRSPSCEPARLPACWAFCEVSNEQ